MQSSSAKVVKNLAVYIYKCLEIRNEVLLNNDSHTLYLCILSVLLHHCFNKQQYLHDCVKTTLYA